MATESSTRSSYSVRETTSFESSPRPASYGHSLVIKRTSSSLGAGGRGSVTVEKKSSRPATSYQPVPEGTYSTLALTGTSNVRGAREQEKRDMQDLNDRFANYLERVKSLEALNRALADDLAKLKMKWGKETTQVKALYQAELDDARHQLDAILKEKARLEIRTTSIEEEIEDIRLIWQDLVQVAARNNEKFDAQTGLLSEYETTIQQLRRTIVTLEREWEKTRTLIVQLEIDLEKARGNLDDETLAHIDFENRLRTVEEEIEFLTRLHEQEMKEVRVLANSGSAAENSNYWKTQIAQTIREIEEMYDEKMQTITTTIKASYDNKIRDMEAPTKADASVRIEISEDSSAAKAELAELRSKLTELSNLGLKLQRELDALRRRKEERERELELINDELKTEAVTTKRELDGIIRQLTLLIDTKLGLELEIAAYRKLLEGEENRLNSKDYFLKIAAAAKAAADAAAKAAADAAAQAAADAAAKRKDIRSISSGELRAKSTFEKTAEGSLSISECDPSGHYVRVENKGKEEESLVGWKIIRIIDGSTEHEFTFSNAYDNIIPGKTISIWALERKPPHAPPLDAEMAKATWGVGLKVITKLQNPEGEDRATHVQTTTFG